MDCSVGTTPGEHWARRPAQRKEGQKLKVNIAKGATLPATISWNGLGEKTNPFAENPDEQVTADPFNSKGQFGAYMGIQVVLPLLARSLDHCSCSSRAVARRCAAMRYSNSWNSYLPPPSGPLM